MTRTAASLFTGIGGFELGMARSGIESQLMCEIDPGAAAVLRARFGAPVHDDVATLDAIPEVDLLLAGFPCTDLSQAGRTKGIEGAASGLIGHVFRLLRARRVPVVVLENVPFMLQLGRGEAMAVIVAVLESLGYHWAYRVVDAMAFGVPQRRRRVYLVACLPCSGPSGHSVWGPTQRRGDPRDILFADDAGQPDKPRFAPDWQSRACGFYWTEGARGLGWADSSVPTIKAGSTVGVPSPPAIVMPGGAVIKPSIRDAERLQGFPADWTRPAEEVVRSGYRWRLVGNAVAPHASEWLGARLVEPGHYEGSGDGLLVRTRSWPRAAYNVGDGVRVAGVSEWPVSVPTTPLSDYLTEAGTPLSARATRGFLKRLDRGTLRLPEGFRDTICAHLQWAEGNA